MKMDRLCRLQSYGIIAVATVALTGCAAAIPLLMVGDVAITGFGAYKTVQITTGGSVSIEFPSHDGKVEPPPPLPRVQRVAIWPGNRGEVMLADRLTSSGDFTVTPPDVVASVIKKRDISSELSQLTANEQRSAFTTVCQTTHVQQVYASIDQGTSSSGNWWSLKRAEATTSAQLLAFSCADDKVISKEKMQLVISSGSSSPPVEEVYKIAANAWADRIMQAQGISDDTQQN